ncbi:MAG: tetratricopeptide repeat protein [Pseudolabrys sp.]
MASSAIKLPLSLDDAVSAYRAGKFAEAEQICLQIVSARRDFFDALYVLAVIEAALGKYNAALTHYDLALALQPQHAEALSNRGNTLKALNRFDEALGSYDRALATQPNYASALTNRGAVLFDLKRYNDALVSYDRALALRPDDVGALYNRAGTLHALNRYDEAIAGYDRAIVLRPDLAEAYANRGNTLNELGLFDQALENFDRAIALRPRLVEAFSNRGNALNKLKRFDEALASYDRAIALHPGHAGAHYNRGTTLLDLKRYDEALTCFDRAIALQPNYPQAFSNRGAALYELMRHAEALDNYDRAIALQPDYPEAHWNAASLRLLTGNFTRGWAEYEWRWKYEAMAVAKRSLAQPLWRGEAIEGRTILLHSEQGLGDAIQFCRYAPLVAARGGQVILEVDSRLRDLMFSLVGVVQVVSAGETLPGFDLHCPLLSLPLAFGTQVETVPAKIPYLHAAQKKRAKWDSRLGDRRRYRVGIAWSGNPDHKRDQMRSISLDAFVPLLECGATIVSVQKDIRPADAAVLGTHPDIHQFGNELADFSDTAALLSSLDLVISVDTSIAHLAGALGRPVWILLPYLPDWRWLLDRDTSPWYPTARLFRQDETRDWNGVIAAVGGALRKFAGNSRS